MDDAKLLKILDRPLQWIFPKFPDRAAQSLRQALGYVRDGTVADTPMMCPLLSIEIGIDQVGRLIGQV
jgi:hypothetical protein